MRWERVIPPALMVRGVKRADLARCDADGAESWSFGSCVAE